MAVLSDGQGASMTLERWDEQRLQTAVRSGAPLLIDLRADWCPQCGPQEGVLERVAPEFVGQVTFGSIDVEQFPSTLEAYGVLGLPTILLFSGGQHQDTLRGFKRAPVIRLALKQLVQP